MSFFRLIFTWKITKEVAILLQSVQNKPSILVFPSHEILQCQSKLFPWGKEKIRFFWGIWNNKSRIVILQSHLHAVIVSCIWCHLSVRTWQLLHSSKGPWTFSSSLTPMPIAADGGSWTSNVFLHQMQKR